MLLKDLSLKIEELNNALCLKPGDINKRIKVRNKIHKSLKSFYPECRLSIYGSSLNGYGTNESDLDLLFLPYPEYHAENHSEVTVDKAVNSPTIYDITSGKVAKEKLLHMDRLRQLCFVRRVIRKDKTFQMALLIQARCPIVRFQIPYLKISCDISCGSSHVVCNTQLLRFYNQIDDRLQPLVITLRHWGKSLGFIKSGILSSYALTLLVVFFLQNVEPPVLPPVKLLQDLSESPILADGWNVAFTLDSRIVKKSENTQSLGELLREFFHFCGEFDFANNIICPSSGKRLPIKELLNSCDNRLKEFEISSMCIQDPFLLSHNTSRNLKLHLFYFFRQAVFLAVKIIDGPELKHNFELLFNIDEYNKLCKNCLIPPMSEKSISFPIDFNLPDSLRKSALEKRKFYESVCDAFLELLQFGLLIDSEIVNRPEISLETFKMEDKDNDFRFLECIQCAVYNRTYVGRAKLEDKDISVVDCDAKQFNNSIIKQEFITSTYLIQQNPLLTSPQPFFWFYCDVYWSFLGKLENLIIVLTPLTKWKESRSTFIFLQSFIEKYLPKVVSNCEPFFK
ncbi:speckle targeted PIP5K1A-regulated poly(A) polymerase [Parasteatoda tepidariorum]|uniref:speckle targeted PIP5K1A-regulated poly(A) polymerase n=1 Tax=Parasteatoda tepidariorum TaxID=114398 RepID=UPI001C71A12B|nr:speckle targeted PIP5K1A-regulated poly(A) polymerase [Parasteatoda tepidariorum]